MSIKMFNIVALSDDAVVINGAGGGGGRQKGGRRKAKAKARKPRSVAKSVAGRRQRKPLSADLLVKP
jgi:hypothetical protein